MTILKNQILCKFIKKKKQLRKVINTGSSIEEEFDNQQRGKFSRRFLRKNTRVNVLRCQTS